VSVTCQLHVSCSADAKVRIVSSNISTIDNRMTECHNLEFTQGVCLPLKNFYINNLNGFPPGRLLQTRFCQCN